MTTASEHQMTEDFLSLRPRLFAVAYRMLGTVHDADDVLQDCFLRWQGCDPHQIDDPVAYLIRITTNLCLDHLRRAKRQRADYPGAWLPEPIVTDGPIDRIDHDVSVALLMALERLTPLERAAFLLRDVFDTDYAEVAATLDRSPAACRKLVERARSHLQDLRPRSVVSAQDGAAITRAFFQASRTGDTKTLARLLAQDAQIATDGGGKVVAAINVIHGRDRLLRFFAGLARKGTTGTDGRWQFCHLNGLPGIVSDQENAGLVQATSVEIQDGQITRIYVVRNPEKTAHLAPLLDTPS
ncbi:Sigma-W factor [Tritonibacter multivorans]|uniref:Sigma-W factor n=2 Tax=Tritonibacter multivorans TaxID=928856 RepID=A0A0P1G3R9_9RHOB|nr:Sigma-W factor [Tritonibacter multivorans]SFD37441.1 RNA polymerase, sigma-24 subunit, RpoE [Tritonibacter multivorans]